MPRNGIKKRRLFIKIIGGMPIDVSTLWQNKEVILDWQRSSSAQYLVDEMAKLCVSLKYIIRLLVY